MGGSLCSAGKRAPSLRAWRRVASALGALPQFLCVLAIDHVRGRNAEGATAETIRQLVEAGLVDYEQISEVEPWEGCAMEERSLRNTLNEYKMSINPGWPGPAASCFVSGSAGTLCRLCARTERICYGGRSPASTALLLREPRPLS